ncbi:hypothetical protein MM221_09770 [Salipaludibacillus sp. LMS25]|jgi:hypothetical protein|uniref:hypothetical protein n=1 Tax=Salipaludibacillus sp. LMS25 TaxID=2924031 RepID=UPI0020D0C7ED|nr:hypothetical protein [Salipaludibacillus sp. LMS25]UTR16750.1 hypothetical protein MM221_09655 [Salipaludibacillus sp. LMS25]UTR16770.1 hypothetical protein MM221_09770 [Salipaludibacillus sp. LMS25]
MANRQNVIREKIALMRAKETIEKFKHLELISFENFDSHWIQAFTELLKQFNLINSTPTYSKPIGDSDESYLSWFEDSLSFLKEKNQWFILVPNCLQPIWANVKVRHFTKAIEELWTISESNSFLIADKSTGNVAKIFCEEKDYEIHVGKCDITKVKK